MSESDSLRKYFTMMPNMLDDGELSPYAVRLFFHVARACGNNPDYEVFEGVRTLAKKLHMSDKKIKDAREELDFQGLIVIKERINPHGGKPIKTMKIDPDIWYLNNLMCDPKEIREALLGL